MIYNLHFYLPPKRIWKWKWKWIYKRIFSKNGYISVFRRAPDIRRFQAIGLAFKGNALKQCSASLSPYVCIYIHIYETNIVRSRSMIVTSLASGSFQVQNSKQGNNWQIREDWLQTCCRAIWCFRPGILHKSCLKENAFRKIKNEKNAGSFWTFRAGWLRQALCACLPWSGLSWAWSARV